MSKLGEEILDAASVVTYHSLDKAMETQEYWPLLALLLSLATEEGLAKNYVRKCITLPDGREMDVTLCWRDGTMPERTWG
jgi:hypothetical protein